MTEETKKVFVAPWKATQIKGIEWGVRIKDGGLLLCDFCEEENAKRFARLPELYDALKGAVKEACGTCAMMHVNPDTYDFVEKGCPFTEENNACDYRDFIAILRKVRDGK